MSFLSGEGCIIAFGLNPSVCDPFEGAPFKDPPLGNAPLDCDLGGTGFEDIMVAGADTAVEFAEIALVMVESP